MKAFLICVLLAVSSVKCELECHEMVESMNSSAHDCCLYPRASASLKIKNSCRDKCENDPHDEHCFFYCVLETLEVIKDNNFEKSGLKKLLSINITNVDDGFLTDEWEPIVDKSIEDCTVNGESILLTLVAI